MTPRSNATCGVLVAATIGAALLSLVGSERSFGGPAPIPLCENANLSFPVCNGSCPPGQGCGPLPGNQSSVNPCFCQPLGCCMFSDFLNGSKALSPCVEGVIETQCQFQGGTFVEGGTCTINGECAVPTATPTPTPTATPSTTPTNTPIPNGGSCADPLDCASGNCVDDVCCDTQCNGPSQACNQPGREGVCSPIAAGAPTVSPGGLVLIMILLVGVGGAALLRRWANAD